MFDAPDDLSGLTSSLREYDSVGPSWNLWFTSVSSYESALPHACEHSVTMGSTLRIHCSKHILLCARNYQCKRASNMKEHTATKMSLRVPLVWLP
jgi:hypothetical protein